MFDFSKNYFELFGMPVDFRVDTQLLAARYRELQKVVHPDRFAAADAQSQRLSLQNATLVNEAYQTLKTPLLRAQYLLRLHGRDIDAQQDSLNDPGFLMQQMALREALAAVPDADDPHASLDALLDEIASLARAQIAELATLLDNPLNAQLDAAVQAVQRMQFLDKLQAEADGVEAQLDEAC